MTRTGVLVMAHGTPASLDDVEPFYTRIRRGRPPSAEQLAELVGRYRAIGGASPLAERTTAQVDGLTAILEAAAPGRYVVRFGAKHTAPSIEEAAADLAGTPGLTRVVGVVLAPHYSSMGAGEYLERAAAALAGGPPLVPVHQWYGAPGLAELLAGRVAAALAGLPGDQAPSSPGARAATVLFTAHSLPERIRDAGDPYEFQVADSAARVMAAWSAWSAHEDKAGGVDWQVAWQSAARTPEPWIGPDVLEVLDDLATAGAGGAVVCPIGFVSDHLEILYDIDVVATEAARAGGLAVVRTASLNADSAFLRILAGVVERAADAPLP